LFAFILFRRQPSFVRTNSASHCQRVLQTAQLQRNTVFDKHENHRDFIVIMTRTSVRSGRKNRSVNSLAAAHILRYKYSISPDAITAAVQRVCECPVHITAFYNKTYYCHRDRDENSNSLHNMIYYYSVLVVNYSCSKRSELQMYICRTMRLSGNVGVYCYNVVVVVNLTANNNYQSPSISAAREIPRTWDDSIIIIIIIFTNTDANY